MVILSEFHMSEIHVTWGSIEMKTIGKAHPTLVLVGDICIILSDFQSWFYSIIEIVLNSWVENLKIPGI